MSIEDRPLSASRTNAGAGDEAAFAAVVAVGTRSPRLGRVQAFDADRGRGSIVSVDGAVFAFHSTAILDGSRQIASGSTVAFLVAASPGGRYEAAALAPVSPA